MKNTSKNAELPQCDKTAVISSLKYWFAKYFICPTIFSDGHIPESYLYEDNLSIHTKRCSRCHSILGLGKLKGFRNCPPPNSTNEQVKEWEIYFDNNLEEIRQSVKGC
ncbi:hypothetical protein SL057_002441, partial [Flavobacterium psychrophilum]|nr:hypothetical protein [Flavobacterium psychrophilum]